MIENRTFPNPDTNDVNNISDIGRTFKLKKLSDQYDKEERKGNGRRTTTFIESKTGRYIKSSMLKKSRDIALDATLRAAASCGTYRRKNNSRFMIYKSDLRYKIRNSKIGNLVVYIVDASGSMSAKKRMEAAKGAIKSFLLDSYQKRDRVAMISFRGNSAHLLLPPTNSVELAEMNLKELSTGGRTPLGKGLQKGLEIIRTEIKKNKSIIPYAVLISDGRANSTDEPLSPWEEAEILGALYKQEKIKSLVIDIEKDDFYAFGLGKKIADIMGARHIKLDELDAGAIVNEVRKNILE